MTVRVVTGEALAALRDMPDESVHCVVTSPPYWGLRSYGGDPGMIGLEPTFEAHLDNLIAVFREVRRVLRKDGTLWLNYGDAYNAGTSAKRQSSAGNDVGGWSNANDIDGERVNAPGLKVKDLMMMPALVAIALRADGWWLRSMLPWIKVNPMPESVRDRPTSAVEYWFLLTKAKQYFYDAEAVRTPFAESSVKRLAQPTFELQEGGPKDAKEGNRSHRKVLENLHRRTPGAWATSPSYQNQGPRYAKRERQRGHERPHEGFCDDWDRRTRDEQRSAGANMRNYIIASTYAFKGAHFATFPPKVIEPWIRAGTSEKGCCSTCGAPWARTVDQDLSDAPTVMATKRAPVDREAVAAYLKEARERRGLSKREVDERLGTKTLYSWFEGRPAGIEVLTPDQWQKLKEILRLDDRFDAAIAATIEVEVIDPGPARAEGVRSYKRAYNARKSTTGWAPTCECSASDPVPCTVLDPFAGSGTVGLVADRLGRDAILIEINPEYADMARRRIESDAPLLSPVESREAAE